MFFRAGEHRAAGLPHDPFKAIVAPRPIGWISAVDARGAVNLAPYSFFNAINSRPRLVMFASEGRKDALAFAEETGEFVCNLVSRDLMDEMNATAAALPRGESEFEAAGLATAPCRIVRAPRVARALAALECRLLQVVRPTSLAGTPTECHVAIGEVVGIHLDPRFVRDGRLDTAAMRPVARMGYDEYAEVTEAFRLTRPAGGGNFDEGAR